MMEKRGNPVGLSTNADMIDGSLERFSGQLKAVADSGADYAEIILHALDLVVNGALHPGRLKNVKRICASFPLSYTIHLPFALNLLDPERGESHLSVFRAGLTLASELGCPAVVYHASSALLSPGLVESFYAPRYGTAEPERLEKLLFAEDAELLSALAEEAAALGVSIGVENPLRYDLARLVCYGTMPAGLAAQVRAVGKKNLGVTLDFGHLYLGSKLLGFDYLDAVKTLAPLALHAHIHDNFGKPDKGEAYIHRLLYGLGDLHLPPGEGSIPLDAALDILAGSGYAGILMLEIEFRFHEEFERHVRRMRERYPGRQRQSRG